MLTIVKPLQNQGEGYDWLKSNNGPANLWQTAIKPAKKLQEIVLLYDQISEAQTVSRPEKDHSKLIKKCQVHWSCEIVMK